MSRGVNKVIIVGNLGSDPEVRYTAGDQGKAIANFSVATSNTWKDKDGIKHTDTEWHRIVFFGKVAEICGEFLKKGSKVYIEGKLVTEKYKDKQGIDRWMTKIQGYEMQMLDGPQKEEGDKTPALETSSTPEFNVDDDLPF